MGTISYDGMIVQVDDRTLSHLQIVIVNKLRRGEAFLMSWKDAVEAGSGRSSIWLHPYVLVHFKFEGGRFPVINDKWLGTLSESADSSRGLIVTTEDGTVPAVVEKRRVKIAMTTVEPSVIEGKLASPRR